MHTVTRLSCWKSRVVWDLDLSTLCDVHKQKRSENSGPTDSIMSCTFQTYICDHVNQRELREREREIKTNKSKGQHVGNSFFRRRLNVCNWDTPMNPTHSACKLWWKVLNSFTKGQSSFCNNEQCTPQHISWLCNKISCGVLTTSMTQSIEV